MPVIDIAKFDIERLTGLKFEEVAKLLEHVKCEVEEADGERVKVEVTHDRPDHFSAEGLARTLKGVAGVETGLPVIKLGPSPIKLVAGHIEERPYISMAVVRGVRLDDEAVRQLIQLQEKIHETYGRGRRRIAIGYYDVSKIKPPIYYRRISQDDEYTPLGFDKPIKVRDMYQLTEQGRRYSPLIHIERPPALVDSAGQIMVVIPVLGSECCKITERTTDVLIDVTGTDPRAVVNALSILIYALLERSGPRQVELVEGGTGYSHEYVKIETDERAVGDLLGVELSRADFLRYVKMARFDYVDGHVVVPPYRINVLSWVDVAEEVAVMIGYNQLPREAPRVMAAGRRHRVEVATQELRKSLLSMGFTEVNNYVLTDDSVGDFCRPARVANPISELYTTVRCSLVPQLVATAAAVKRREVKLFEVGEVVREGRTVRALALLISREGATLTDGLSAIKALCHRLGWSCKFKPLEAAWALPSRAAEVVGDVAGYVAEVNPDILTKLRHTTPTVAAELFIHMQS
ncbi:phenylalanine--tRNA ligase subunit beta [Pyrobaculum ferrireducens]|uniref:phenylalanine--tRNA ligase n=1 Tax=Pyrobaculum ferrireducens TaxID=1104324 RepID=G7VDR9_9CREN|nr:phenylalanine--tRNA ligase subunit beta [Pyrobaculum ferrireducens]AET31501.1 phenylalanyl-tRNA synthetase subunit beta [Pyrobaculum ferrireducens]